MKKISIDMRELQLKANQLNAFCHETLASFTEKQILLLSGPMGAGKTELVKHLVEALGGEMVASPTYSLIHEYLCEKRSNVYHIDLYRLEDEEDLDSTGFWDLFENESGLIIVEWADRVSSSLWPLHWQKSEIQIDVPDDGKSRIYRIS